VPFVGSTGGVTHSARSISHVGADAASELDGSMALESMVVQVGGEIQESLSHQVRA